MICYFLKCFTVKKVSLKCKIGYKRFLLAMSVRDEDQTCTNTDDLTSNKFEQQPQKKKKKQRWTLMDFATAENHWPTFKNNEQA